MTNVVDVASHILLKLGPMTAMKLQKLVFYAQAKALAERGSPLFQEQIQAWDNGPVCRKLFDLHKGQHNVKAASFEGTRPLSAQDEHIVDSVLTAYGAYTAEVLSELTHNEDPWRKARASGRRDDEITTESMLSFYRGREFSVYVPATDGESEALIEAHCTPASELVGLGDLQGEYDASH
jgi:uncharacterized phage-associated protein